MRILGGASWDVDLSIGDQVWWNDPNADLLTGYYTISVIKDRGETFVLTRSDGFRIEVGNHEIMKEKLG